MNSLEIEALKKMMAFNRQFMETNKPPEIQEITEFMCTITGAEYALFNRLDDNGLDVVTMAVAGAPEYLMKISKVLGFNLVGKRWPLDKARKAAIEDNNLTTFENLQSSMGNVLPPALVKLLEKTFNIGQVSIIKINKLDEIIGEFTLLMTQGQSLSQPELANLFASQVGLFLDRMKYQQDLENEHQRLADIIEATHAGVWEFNVQTEENSYNERWTEMLGYNLLEMQPTNVKSWRHLVHPEDYQRANYIFEEAIAKDIMYVVEFRMKHKDGHWVWVEDRGKLVSRTDEGKPLLMRGTRTDITERKGLEIALANSEKTYRAYVDQSPLAIFVTNGTGRYLRANPAACQLTGYREEELKNLTIHDLAPPEGVSQSKKNLVEINENGNQTAEYIGLKKNGQHYHGRIHIAAISDQEIISFAEDITERKRAEEKIATLGELQKALTEIANTFINLPIDKSESTIVNSLEYMGNFTNIDRVYIFSYNFEQNTCSNTHEWCQEGIVPQIEKLQNIPLETIPDWVVHHKEGKEMWISDVGALPQESELFNILEPQGIKSMISIPMMDGTGCIGFVGFDAVRSIHDFSEKERDILWLFAQMLVNLNNRNVVQNKLIEATKNAERANEAKSRYLAHMNHEIRTPLNGFMGFLQLMDTTNLDQQQQEYMQHMKLSTRHMLNIINNVLDYAKIEAGEMKLTRKPFNLEDEVQTALAPLRSMAKQNNIQLALKLDTNLPRQVEGDPVRLRQILLNLGSNAVKFTQEGQVHIAITCPETTETHHVLQLVMEDTGSGMTEETLKKLFKPFYQADDGITPQSKGTGLGMAITRELVELMEGEIQVNSTLGIGTRVEVKVKLFKCA